MSHLLALVVGVALGSSLAAGPLNPVAVATYSVLLILLGWTAWKWIGERSDHGGRAGPTAKRSHATEKLESMEIMVPADEFECPAMAATESMEVIVPEDGCERCNGDPHRCPACGPAPFLSDWTAWKRMGTRNDNDGRAGPLQSRIMRRRSWRVWKLWSR